MIAKFEFKVAVLYGQWAKCAQLWPLKVFSNKSCKGHAKCLSLLLLILFSFSLLFMFDWAREIFFKNQHFLPILFLLHVQVFCQYCVRHTVVFIHKSIFKTLTNFVLHRNVILSDGDSFNRIPSAKEKLTFSTEQNIFKGVLHPWPILWLFMHFSQKLQYIGDR